MRCTDSVLDKNFITNSFKCKAANQAFGSLSNHSLIFVPSMATNYQNWHHQLVLLTIASH